MKFLFSFLLFPLLSFGQTVHIKDDNIEYEGKVKIAGISADELYNRVVKDLPSAIKKNEGIKDDKTSGTIKTRGEIRLESPRELIRTAIYSIKITVSDEGYHYHIDSVSLKEKTRGGKTKLIPSKELLERMDESGKPAIVTEKILNEIDMRFQKILAMLHNKLQSS